MARDRGAFPCLIGVVPVDGAVGIGPSTLSIDDAREYASEPRLPVDSRRRRNGRVSCNDPAPLLCTAADLRGATCIRSFGDLQPLCSDVSSEHCSFLGGRSADVPPGLSVGVDFQSNLQLLDGMAYRNPCWSCNSYGLRAAYLWAAILRNLDLWGPDLWSARRGSAESHRISAYISSNWLSTYRLPADDLLITGVSWPIARRDVPRNSTLFEPLWRQPVCWQPVCCRRVSTCTLSELLECLVVQHIHSGPNPDGADDASVPRSSVPLHLLAGKYRFWGCSRQSDREP